MGEGGVSLRVVLDTNCVVSALLFGKGRLAWLRHHWQKPDCVLLVSKPTIEELIRVMAYPKFGLGEPEIHALLGDYLPYATSVGLPSRMPDLPQCRDVHDQKFIELVAIGKADVLVSGDADLLELNGVCPFTIESPADFQLRLNNR